MKSKRLVSRETDRKLTVKLLTRKITRVVSLHEKETGRQEVLRLEFDDDSVVLIFSSRSRLSFGWVKYNS